MIMSVYRGDAPEHLKESLQSLADQTYQGFDLLLYIDGPVSSKIDSVIECYSELVTYVYKSPENMGLSVALNYLILNFYPEYDVFVRQDADDVSFNDRLSVVYDYMSKNPDVDVFSSYVREFHRSVDESILARYPLTNKSRIAEFSHATVFPHVSSAIRSEYFIKSGLYPGLSFYTEDQWLWASGLSKGCSFHTHDQPLVYVRTSGHISRRNNLRIYLNLFFMKLALASNLKLGIFWRAKLFSALLIRLLPARAVSLIYRIYKH